METAPRSTHPFSGSQQRTPWVARAGGSAFLPVSLTSFVGREDEIVLANGLLQRPEVRLLSLTGPGGIGKTRLAIEIATGSGELFPNGLAFVSLASIQDASMVMVAVASTLGLHELDGSSIGDVVASSLGTSKVLLVLDNFEHVLDAAPALTSLLSRCPHLKIMVTSRSLLRVEGEHSIPVPSLVLPQPTAEMTHEDWLSVPVIKLFIERASAIDPSLAWNPDDMARLVEICGRLDGLPLAVELAATRVRHFSLAEINDRLNDLLPLLVDGSRDHPSRLRTMRNAIAWSYDLLPPGAQALLRHASVFSGGFTLEAILGVSEYLDAATPPAESVDPASPATEADPPATVEDRISMLIDSSLLVRETGQASGTARYRMLETIREYAREQMDARGEGPVARHAHAMFFTRYARQHEIAELIPEHIRSMDLLLAEQDNLRSALAWLWESSDHELFGGLVAALGRFWLAQANYRESRTWFERALAVQPALDPADSARILVSLGMAEIFLEANEPAETHLAQGMAACRAHGEASGEALALIGLAGLAVARGEGERSVQLLTESREAIAAMPDGRLAGIMSGWVSINLAVAARTLGNREQAERHIEDALGRFRAERFQIGTMMALGDLGDLACDRGDWTRALSLYKEALAEGRVDQARRIVIELIESTAIVAAHAGQMDHAATLLGAAGGVRDRIGLRYRQPRNRASLDDALETIRSGLAAESFSAAWESGRELTESQAIARILGFAGGAPPEPKSPLTNRETDVLRLLATGMTDPEIADTLFISVRTVEHHVANVCRKLGVRTRTAATSTAIAAGLVEANGADQAALPSSTDMER